MNKKKNKLRNKNSKHIDDKTYQIIMDLIPIPTVDILFFDTTKTKILLFKRTNAPLKNKYFSTGGRQFKNETIENCALRQASSEAGLKLKKEDIIFCGTQDEIYTTSRYKKTGYHCVNSFYATIIKDEKNIKLDSQHNTYKWFNVNNNSLHKYIKKKIITSLKVI